jgi:hypothetical protein
MQSYFWSRRLAPRFAPGRRSLQHSGAARFYREMGKL